MAKDIAKNVQYDIDVKKVDAKTGRFISEVIFGKSDGDLVIGSTQRTGYLEWERLYGPRKQGGSNCPWTYELVSESVQDLLEIVEKLVEWKHRHTPEPEPKPNQELDRESHGG